MAAMNLEKYLNSNESTNLLKRFSFVGRREDFDKKLRFLEKMAEEERWRFKGEPGDKEEDFNVLFYYIIHAFDRCFKQGKICINSDETAAAFNTGLMTAAGEEILCVFVKSTTHTEGDSDSCHWYLRSFEKETSRNFLDLNLKVPEMATFFESYEELYFDPEYEIVLNFDHIFEDNFDRLPPTMQQLDKDIACQVFNGFLNHTIKKIKRNSRIPVPQFYNDKIMFLVPVKAFEGTPIVLALEKYEKQYRANTILTMNMAYNCARLLTRPESNWLLLG